MSTPLALLCVLVGLVPGLGLAAFQWHVARSYRKRGIAPITLYASCEHLSFSGIGLVDVSCPHCGSLELYTMPQAVNSTVLA